MGKLYIVPTPIGNLEDITFRAVSVLKNADFILAEDTRTSSVLLKHYKISSKLMPYHKFNEHKMVEQLASKVFNSESVALISDSGTPGISDPGFLLVKNCIQIGVEVETLPGPTALIPALVNSGLPCERFIFEGFLPHKKGRTKRLTSLIEEQRTMVFYESPHRLVKTLGQFADFFGQSRRAMVARELTKIHEENVRGELKEILHYFENKKVKGECVIIVEGKNLKTKHST